MNDVKQQIADINETTPVANERKARKNIIAPDSPVVSQDLTTHTESRDSGTYQGTAGSAGAGIDFDPNANTPVTGLALPNTSYDTDFQTDEGNPTYLKAGTYQPNAWPVVQAAEKAAFDAQKIDFLNAINKKSGDYVGYIPLREDGNLSMWSHFVGSVYKEATSLIPVRVPKAATGAVAWGTKAGNVAFKSILPGSLLTSPMFKNTAFGRFVNDVLSSFDTAEEITQSWATATREAVQPMEDMLSEQYEADLSDTGLSKQIARGIGSGAVMVGTGAMLSGLTAATQVPGLVSGLYAMSEQDRIYKQAIDSGYSSSDAAAWSVLVPAISTAADNIQILGSMGRLSLGYKAAQDVINNIKKTGKWKTSVGTHALRQAGAMLGEGAIEMGQTTLEEWNNPEFQETMIDQLFVAAVSAVALRGVGVPFAVRHAKLEEQYEFAKMSNCVTEYKKLRESAESVVNDMVEKGAIDAKDRDSVLHSMMSENVDTLIENLRLGYMGDIDKISESDRADMDQMIKTIDEKFGSNAFSPQVFKELDAKVVANMTPSFKKAYSADELKMIQGLVRGVYVSNLISNGVNGANVEFKIPTFDFNPKRSESTQRDGEIIIGRRSDTIFSNNSPQYAGLVQKGFQISSEPSDRIVSVIHEMGHWLDQTMGAGFSDFLDSYYRSIQTVFGEKKAEAVRNVAEARGADKRYDNASYNKKDYTSEGNTSEYFAQASARMGKRVAESFGLGKSEANRFLTYANIILNRLGNLNTDPNNPIYKALADWQTAVQKEMTNNFETLSKLIDAFGSDRLRQTIKDFLENNLEGYDVAEYLASKDMLGELYDIMDTINNAAGLEKMQALFDDGAAMENFVTKGDIMFRSGYDNAVAEVQARRDMQALDLSKAKPIAKGDLDNIVAKALGLEQGESFAERGARYAKEENEAIASIAESFEGGKKEQKPVPADVAIDGRDLSQDIAQVNAGISHRAQVKMNPIVKWAVSSKWGWGLHNILTTLLGKDIADKYNVLGKYGAKKAIRSKYWDEFMDRLKPILGEKGFITKYKTRTTALGMSRIKDVDIMDPMNPEIKMYTRNITGWEALYVYLMVRQGYGDRIQRGVGMDVKDIIATLSEEEIKFGDAMSKQLMDMYERTFHASPYSDVYFPILDATHEFFNELSIDSLRARQAGITDTIALADAGRVFSQYVSRWASHESGFFQTMKRLQDVFGYRGASDQIGPGVRYDGMADDARIKESARLAHRVVELIGKNGYDNMMNIFRNQLKDGNELMFDATRNSTVNQMGHSIIKSLLAFKPVSFVKNMSNIAMMWGGAKNQSMYWNGVAEGLADPKRTWKYMMEHSSEIKQRWGRTGGINEYLDQDTLGGNTSPVMSLLAKAKWDGDATHMMAKLSAVLDNASDRGLKAFMQTGDAGANIFGGYGLIKDYMAQGMTEAQAFKKLDQYIVERQSSSNLMMKPLVQLENANSVMGQIFAFTSEGVAKWASILGNFDEIKMGTKAKSEAIANAISISLSMLLFSAVAAGAWDLASEDENAQKDAQEALISVLSDQITGGLVAGSAFISPVIAGLVGDSRMSGMSVPIYSYAMDGVSALRKGEYDRILAKTLAATGILVGADNAWNIMLGVSMQASDDEDVRYAGRLMLSGYTPSRAKKRSGVDVRKDYIEKNDDEE